MRVNTASLLETLTAELERPRELTPQAVRHIGGTYDVDRGAMGAFLTERLAGMEDDEIDLIFSHLFTPKLADQAVIAETLGPEAVARDRWPALIEQLAAQPARPVVARLIHDGDTYRVPLRPVTIERYVQRLRLDGAIPASLFALIERAAPTDRPMLKAVARRAIWEGAERRDILEHYLSAAMDRKVYSLADAVALLDLVESHKPASRAFLLGQLPRWQETLQRVLDTGVSGPSPFFTQQVELAHGGARDHRSVDQSRVAAKQNDLAFLGRLERVLGG